MRVFIKFYLAAIILMTPLFVYADKEAPPKSYEEFSPDKKFVFVMIAPIDYSRDGRYFGEEGVAKEKRIRATYPKSGMYSNDGSTKPLWTVDWYSRFVLVASDGIHLVRMGPWAMKGSNEAFTFFANGKKIRSYKINDLVRSIKDLPHTASHFSWLGYDGIKLDESKFTFSVSTLNDEH